VVIFGDLGSGGVFPINPMSRNIERGQVLRPRVEILCRRGGLFESGNGDPGQFHQALARI
jgi:hypothetical protein